MKTKWFQFLMIITTVVVILGAGAFFIEHEREAEFEGEAEYPTALGKFLEKQREAVPGPEEGPGSAAEVAFQERAYPAGTISVAQMNNAAAAFEAVKGRPFPRGKGRPGAWVTIGPDEALYPGTPLLTSADYIPNSYVAGGRTTSIAISDTCKPGNCRIYVTPAGGGVWRTKNALNGQPHWEYLAGPLGINAAGSVYLDPNDASGNTVYVGTGEANVCGSGCVAGAGVYRSTDGGDTWTKISGSTFDGLGVGAIIVKAGSSGTIYVATTTALRGISSTCCSGITRPVPGAGQWGLYKSTDGGASWTFIHNGSADETSCTGDLNEFNNGDDCSPRGVRALALDPSDPNIVYAGSYARGVWRSNDEGDTWTQIKPSLSAGNITTRPSIAVNTLPNGKTRMYVYEGAQGSPRSRLERSDDVATGAPAWMPLTSTSTADPGWAWDNLCGSQCWYDQFVYTPKGYPDIVYVGGSYSYGQPIANKRGVVFSDDAGVTGYDMTFDGTDPIHPNGLHPDQHAIVTNPNNPYQFFETSDGGVMRSSGELVDRSYWCDDRNLSTNNLNRCRQMLSRIPSKLESLNKGLSTLQFQSLSVSPHNVNVLQGGTQDNGTWQTSGNPNKWENTMIGDGGQSGFDVA
ncbi:MAG: exo-alpha-sialidase, partial [Candidatus Promineifilaceae bacterium]